MFDNVDFDFDTILEEIETYAHLKGASYSEFIANATQEEKDILKSVQYKNLSSKDYDYLESTKDKAAMIINLRCFFGVESLSNIELSQKVAFRIARAKNINPYALAAWLRKGEILAENLKVPIYNKSGLMEILPQLKNISYEMPKDFYEQTADLLCEVGVGLVAVENPSNTAVNGAVRILDDKIILYVSTHRKRYDIFWFSLFHEIGHIILHDIKNQEFISLNCDEYNQSTDKEEIEADNYASNILINPTHFDMFLNKGDFSFSSVSKFSKLEGVHSSIVFGRLAKFGYVEYKYISKYLANIFLQDGKIFAYDTK